MLEMKNSLKLIQVEINEFRCQKKKRFQLIEDNQHQVRDSWLVDKPEAVVVVVGNFLRILLWWWITLNRLLWWWITLRRML